MSGAAFYFLVFAMLLLAIVFCTELVLLNSYTVPG